MIHSKSQKVNGQNNKYSKVMEGKKAKGEVEIK